MDQNNAPHSLNNGPSGLRIQFGPMEFSGALKCATSDCHKFAQFGVGLVVNDQPQGIICPKCIATAISKYQRMHPGESLIQEDVYIESTDMQSNIDHLLDKCFAGYDLKDSDKRQFIDAVQWMFDGDGEKFENLGDES